MLIELSVANYRSFKERVTLSMEAESRLHERDRAVDERNIASTPHGDILRVAGVYGANASGKSNLVRAISTLRWLVLDSAREGTPPPADPFRLDDTSRTEPTEIEVVYGDESRQVRYGAAFTRERISHEWLFIKPLDADEEVRWFERRHDPATDSDIYETGGEWSRNEAFEAATAKESLHLSIMSKLKNPQAKAIRDWFRDLQVLNGLSDGAILRQTTRLLDGPQREAIVGLVKSLDVCIDDLHVVELDEESKVETERMRTALAAVLPGVTFGDTVEKRITTRHRTHPFELADESAGTVRAIALAGPIIEALATGRTVVVDEFDARLHTLLAKKLVELFQDPELNHHNAQLIFASHDTNLLTRTLLRRDQLWFVEKSRKTQASDLYSLAELRYPDGKKVRNDASYEDDYLAGRYGAIPFFGGLKAFLHEALAPTVPESE